MIACRAAQQSITDACFGGMLMSRHIVAALGVCLSAAAAHAALVASATTLNYTNAAPLGTGWTTASPTGFQDFVLTSNTMGPAGFFIHAGPAFVNDNSGNSFDMYSARDIAGSYVNATLPFIENAGTGSGPLDPGQTFSARMMTNAGAFKIGGTAGLRLSSGAGQVFEFRVDAVADSSLVASYVDSTGTHALAFSSDQINGGVELSFALVTPTSFSFSATNGAYNAVLSSTETVVGTIDASPLSATFFRTTGSGTGTNTNTQFDRMSIVGDPVPEPTGLALIGLSAVATLRRRRAKVR